MILHNHKFQNRIALLHRTSANKQWLSFVLHSDIEYNVLSFHTFSTYKCSLRNMKLMCVIFHLYRCIQKSLFSIFKNRYTYEVSVKWIMIRYPYCNLTTCKFVSNWFLSIKDYKNVLLKSTWYDTNQYMICIIL